jgi:four helix bundle protein
MWQKARALAKKLHPVYTNGSFGRDFPLRDQINRSSGSIMDNIAEGFDRDGRREFIQFLTVSKGSASETLSQLYRALDRGYISEEQFSQFNSEVNEVNRLIGGMIRTLKKSDYRGHKFDNNNDQVPDQNQDQD